MLPGVLKFFIIIHFHTPELLSNLLFEDCWLCGDLVCKTQIENNLHWVMDVTFRQDECRIRTGDAAANLATIKHAAVNLLRRDTGKMSIPQKRHSAAWDDDYMYKIITQ
jgi:hypothetical protein